MPTAEQIDERLAAEEYDTLMTVLSVLAQGWEVAAILGDDIPCSTELRGSPDGLVPRIGETFPGRWIGRFRMHQFKGCEKQGHYVLRGPATRLFIRSGEVSIRGAQPLPGEHTVELGDDPWGPDTMVYPRLRE